MGGELFHLDRAQALEVGMSLDQRLTNRHPGTGKIYEVTTKQYDQIESLFEDGLTGHGITYVFNPSINSNILIEMFFEFHRRSEFPEANSRMQSVFGAETIPDLKDRAGMDSVDVGSGDVYLVETDDYSIHDASLLNDFGSFIDSVIAAEKYWSGEGTDEPVWEVLMEPKVEVIEYVGKINEL